MRANRLWNLDSAACASPSFARVAGSYMVTYLGLSLGAQQTWTTPACWADIKASRRAFALSRGRFARTANRALVAQDVPTGRPRAKANVREVA